MSLFASHSDDRRSVSRTFRTSFLIVFRRCCVWDVGSRDVWRLYIVTGPSGTWTCPQRNPERKIKQPQRLFCFFYDRVKWTWITAADELSPRPIGMPNLCAKFFLVCFLKTCVYRWTQIVFSVKFESVVVLFLTGIIQEKSGENEEEGERERERKCVTGSKRPSRRPACERDTINVSTAASRESGTCLCVILGMIVSNRLAEVRRCIRCD